MQNDETIIRSGSGLIWL
jgi:putative transposase